MDITGNPIIGGGTDPNPTFDSITIEGGLENTEFVVYEEGPEQGTPDSGKLITYAKSDGNLYAKNDLGIEKLLTGNATSLIWKFQTALTPPASGYISFNNATPALVTVINIHETDPNGNNTRSLLQALNAGDSIFLANNSNTKNKYYEITGSTDNGTYFSYNVNFIAQNNTNNYLQDEVLNTKFFITSNPFDQDLNTTDSPTFTGLDLSNGKLTNLSNGTDPNDAVNKSQLDTKQDAPLSSLTLVIPKYDNSGNLTNSDIIIEETKVGDNYVLENTLPDFTLRSTGTNSCALRFESDNTNKGQISYNSSNTDFRISSDGANLIFDSGNITHESVLPNFIIKQAGTGGATSLRFSDNSGDKANLSYNLTGTDVLSMAAGGATLSFDAGNIIANPSGATPQFIIRRSGRPELILENTTGNTGLIEFQDNGGSQTARIEAIANALLVQGRPNTGIALNITGDVLPGKNDGTANLGIGGNPLSSWNTVYSKDLYLRKDSPSITLRNDTPTLSSALISFQDSTATEKASIAFVNDQSLSLRADTSVSLITQSIGKSVQMDSNGHLIPGSLTQDLGTVSNTWRTLYAQNINLTGSIVGQVKSYGELTMFGNATATNIAITGIPVKVAGTTTAGLNNDFTHTNNRLTYTGTQAKIFNLQATFTWELASGVADLASMWIYKNGSVIGKSRLQGKMNDTLANYPRNASITILESLSQNDYVELWVSNDGATNNMLVSYIQFNAIEITTN